jgi:thiamine monophosphate synthase
VFPTPSKDTVVTGLEELLRVRRAVSVPLVAIGGLTPENVAEVKKAGADSVAVIGAILGADSPETAAREIIKAFEG